MKKGKAFTIMSRTKLAAKKKKKKKGWRRKDDLIIVTFFFYTGQNHFIYNKFLN